VAAGFFGDNYGTFAPIYVIYGAMMALLPSRSWSCVGRRGRRRGGADPN